MTREELPNRHKCETFKVKVGAVSWFITLDYYEDGRLGGLVLKTAKAGSEQNEMMHVMSCLASLALQRGSPKEEIIAQLHRSGPDHVCRAIASVLREA